MCCIKLDDGGVRAKAIISNCKFTKCNGDLKKDFSSIGMNEKNTIYVFRYITEIKNCTLKKIYGVNIGAQLVGANIEKCKFIYCKKDEVGEGFLSINVDMSEPIVFIKDCSFIRCVNEDTYNSGIIYLGSGMPLRENIFSFL